MARVRYSIAMEPPTAAGLKVLYSREQIAERIVALAAAISRDYAGEPVILVGVLKGAAIFLSDLARGVTLDATFDFLAVSSYGKGTRSDGAVKLIKDLDQSISSKNVLLVEDISIQD